MYDTKELHLCGKDELAQIAATLIKQLPVNAQYEILAPYIAKYKGKDIKTSYEKTV